MCVHFKFCELNTFIDVTRIALNNVQFVSQFMVPLTVPNWSLCLFVFFFSAHIIIFIFTLCLNDVLIKIYRFFFFWLKLYYRLNLNWYFVAMNWKSCIFFLSIIVSVTCKNILIYQFSLWPYAQILLCSHRKKNSRACKSSVWILVVAKLIYQLTNLNSNH